MEDVESGRQLLTDLEKALSPAEGEALRYVESYCAERRVGLYLVGGAVRDLLLGRRTVDLDLAVEGETASIASALADATGGKATLHERFGTASVKAPGFSLDLAQTRRESYERPGALPSVEPVESILDDLARRDFTINAITLRLTPPVALIDPFGGEADLRAGFVRVLHEQSFQDDATRILRAIRYATRLEFRIETETLKWLVRDRGFVDRVSGPRLLRELVLMLEERCAPAAVEQAASLAVMEAIQPWLAELDSRVYSAWEGAFEGPQFAPLAEFGLCLMTGFEDVAFVEALTRRLHLTKSMQRALQDFVYIRDAFEALLTTITPVEVVDMLEGRSPAAVWAESVLAQGFAARACLLYLAEWRHVQPELTGKDLIAMGVPAGEGLGVLLKRLRDAYLTGQARSREDEERIVRAELAEGETGR